MGTTPLGASAEGKTMGEIARIHKRYAARPTTSPATAATRSPSPGTALLVAYRDQTGDGGDVIRDVDASLTVIREQILPRARDIAGFKGILSLVSGGRRGDDGTGSRRRAADLLAKSWLS